MITDPHTETHELLPWLANGTLAGAERERVEAHLGQCPACRARLEWERSLHDSEAPPAPPLSATLAFARLAPRLGPQEGGAALPVRWSRLAAANDPRWLRSVAAVQLGVIFILGLVIVWPGSGPARDAAWDVTSKGDRYITLGARPAALGNLVVSFEPGTPERELRRILQVSGARIVDGPTDVGAYVLSVPAAQAEPALQRLRAEPAVTLAEPLAGDGR
jgi:hypothetical protein